MRPGAQFDHGGVRNIAFTPCAADQQWGLAPAISDLTQWLRPKAAMAHEAQAGAEARLTHGGRTLLTGATGRWQT
jgi:hypothetical protein